MPFPECMVLRFRAVYTVRSHLTASLLATGALLFLPLQAFGQAEYDDAVGRPVDILLSKYGPPPPSMRRLLGSA